jgi:hypothetical protein
VSPANRFQVLSHSAFGFMDRNMAFQPEYTAPVVSKYSHEKPAPVASGQDRANLYNEQGVYSA